MLGYLLDLAAVCGCYLVVVWVFAWLLSWGCWCEFGVCFYWLLVLIFELFAMSSVGLWCLGLVCYLWLTCWVCGFDGIGGVYG